MLRFAIAQREAVALLRRPRAAMTTTTAGKTQSTTVRGNTDEAIAAARAMIRSTR